MALLERHTIEYDGKVIMNDDQIGCRIYRPEAVSKCRIIRPELASRHWPEHKG